MTRLVAVTDSDGTIWVNPDRIMWIQSFFLLGAKSTEIWFSANEKANGFVIIKAPTEDVVAVLNAAQP